MALQGFATGGGETVDDYVIREHAYLAKISEMEREVEQYKHMAVDIQSRFDDKFEKTSLRHAMVRHLIDHVDWLIICSLSLFLFYLHVNDDRYAP